MDKFGGHKAAAGVTLKAENIPAFRQNFEKIVSHKTTPEDFMPELVIDCKICASDVSVGLADDLEALAPFGKGNPEPIFMLTDMDVLSARVVGTHHLQMRLRPSKDTQARPLDSILFNSGTDSPPPKRFKRIACHIRWNRWRGRKNIQLVVKDFLAA